MATPAGSAADLLPMTEEMLRELQAELQAGTVAEAAPASRYDERHCDDLALASLRQRLVRARDLMRPALDEEEVFPTGLAAVDGLLAGGVARGCLTEVRGAPSSGRFGLVLALLAATTARGEAAALVDLGDQLDPQEAARCGVELPRLLWARPQRMREALAAAEILLGGQFPLVVLELGVPPLPGSARDEHAWLRLARAARQHRAALLVATPWRITGSAAGEVLALAARRGRWLGEGRAPRLLAGVDARLVREKSRRQPELASAALGLRAAELLGDLQRERPRHNGEPPGDERTRRTEIIQQQSRPHAGRKPGVAAVAGIAVPPGFLPGVRAGRTPSLLDARGIGH